MSLPRKILPRLAWSFKEPVPGSFPLFLAALRTYGEAIGAPVVESELQTPFPLPSMDIEYAYARQEASGAWTHVPVKVAVRGVKPPTHAELLFELHLSAAKWLHDQDHCFFEGLWLLDRENEKGIPAYEVYLGS